MSDEPAFVYEEPIFVDLVLEAPMNSAVWTYCIDRFYPQRWLTGVGA